MRTATLKDTTAARLRGIPMFAELAEHDLEALGRLVQPRRFSRGAVIVSQAAAGGCMYLLVSGRVKVALTSPEGKELALNYLEAPSHFGEMSLIDEGRRTADVIANTDVEVLALEGRDLSAAIQIQPKLALSLIATLSTRLRQTIARLEEMAFHDATHRVMRVILNIATASYESKGVPVVEGLTHYDIATLAGTSRETASRVLSMLAREEIVATRGRRIVVDIFALHDRLELD